MIFENRKYHTLPRTRDGRPLANLSLPRVYDVPATLSENSLGMDVDPKFHLVYQGDCATDLCDSPYLLDVSLVRKTDAQALVGECCV